MSHQALSLVFFDGDGYEQWRKEIPEGESYLGRSEECLFRVEHQKLSRQHIKFRRENDVIYLENISSFGEVKVNGESREHVEVRLNDKISFDGGELQVKEITIDEPQVNEEPSDESLESGPSLQSMTEEDPLQRESSIPLGEAAVGFADEVADDGRTQINQLLTEGKLIIQTGSEAGREFSLAKNEIFVGRSPACDIVVNDDGLSRKHFKIIRGSGGYRITDLESSNGTRVNGIRIIEQELKSYDLVTIGQTDLRFILVHKDWNQNEATSVSSEAFDGSRQQGNLQALPSGALEEAEFVEDLGSTYALVEGGSPPNLTGVRGIFERGRSWWQGKSKKQKIIYILLALLIVAVISSSRTKPTEDKKSEVIPILKSTNPDIPEAFFELSEEDQLEIERHYNNAIRAMQQGNWLDVTKEGNAIKARIPNYKEIDDILTKAKEELRRLDLENYNKIDKEEEGEKGNDIYFYLEEGNKALAESRFDEAIEYYKSSLELDPVNTEAKRGLRAAQARQTDKDWEKRENEKKVQEDQAVTDVVNRGRLLISSESFEEGIKVLEEALTMRVHDSQIHEAAKKWIEHAVQARRQKYAPDLVEAAELIKNRKFSEAYELCENVVTAVPNYEEAKKCMNVATAQLQFHSRKVYRQALIDEYLGNHTRAKQQYQRIIQSFPETDLYHQRAATKLKRYDPEE